MNNEKNTCVYKEYERLKGLFLSGNEDKLPLVDELLKKVAFLEPIRTSSPIYRC